MLGNGCHVRPLRIYGPAALVCRVPAEFCGENGHIAMRNGIYSKLGMGWHLLCLLFLQCIPPALLSNIWLSSRAVLSLQNVQGLQLGLIQILCMHHTARSSSQLLLCHQQTLCQLNRSKLSMHHYLFSCSTATVSALLHVAAEHIHVQGVHTLQH